MNAKSHSPLFDPRRARGPRRGPDVGRDVTDEILGRGAASAALTVSALVARVKRALAQAFPQRVCVVGEISNLTLHASGHVYFRLKDAAATIDAAMFHSATRRIKFTPADGMEVVAEGRVDVYDVRGQLQLYVETLTPRGQGALELAFRQLREKLAGEGLFDPAHKKPLPRFPRAVGVVTSPTGAAIRDIRRTLARRWPATRVYLLPALVQGDQAAADIAAAIALLDANAPRLSIDTILVGRGGGSLEDLWAFNEEVVARAVFAARTPVISGVGHEIDVTICDLVADARAATPTAAAEIAVPDRRDILRHVQTLEGRLTGRVSQDLRSARSALGGVLRSVVFRDPSYRLRTRTQHLDELSHRLRAGLAQTLTRGRNRLQPAANALASQHPARMAERAAARLDRLLGRLAWALGGRSKRAGDCLADLAARLRARHPMHRLALARQQIRAAARQLDAMSYRGVLRRGFSVTRDAGGKILRCAAGVRPNQRVQTELADGAFSSIVADPDGPVAEAPNAPPKRRARHAPADDGPTLFD